MTEIIHIIGKRKRGKSTLAGAMIINEDMQYNNWRYRAACNYIKNFNKVYDADLTLPPQRHVVYGNLDIKRKFPNMESYKMSGFDFGAPNPYFECKRLMPYGVYVFDECQKYFDSKGETKDLPPWVTQAFELSGHIFIKIILISQRDMRLHKDIREIVDRIIFVDKSIHTFEINGRKIKANQYLDKGKLIKTEWFGREFENYEDVEAYRKDKTIGEKFYYKFDGDIREHVDAFSYATTLENLEKDFSYFDYDEISVQRPDAWNNYKKQLSKEANSAR